MPEATREIESFIKHSKEQKDACLPIVLWSKDAEALIDEIETMRNRIAELEAELNFLRLSNLDNLTRLEGEG